MPALDPVELARLASLPLRTRAVVEGVLTGLHRSPRQGQAVEFAQHKEYAPGDELRLVDWRAYARVDKYYVKKFQLETNLRAWLLLDCSGSMAYGGRGLTKLAYGQVLAGALASLLVRQGDGCGMVASARASVASAAARSVLPSLADRAARDDRLPDGVVAQLPPRSTARHLEGLLELLGGLEAAGATGIGAALRHVAEQASGRPLVIVLSDLLEGASAEPDDVAAAREDELGAALALLRSRGCDMAVFQLLDEDELTFPFDEPTEFLSLEGAGRVQAHPAALREAYLARLQALLEQTRRACLGAGAEYRLVSTSASPVAVLLDFLSARRAGRGATTGPGSAAATPVSGR